MAAVPIYNVVVPYVGAISGGLTPGRMVRIHGTTPVTASRFAVNLQCGPNTNPRDDIAVHLSVRFPENKVVRNSLHSMNWGPEESTGQNPILRAQNFELLILCDHDNYKIAINGQHFAEFIHRIPYQRVSHLTIDGDVTISMINFEGGSPGSQFAPPGSAGFVQPSAPGGVPYPPPSYSPTPPSYGVPPYPPASGAYAPATGPYPPAVGPYPPASGPYPSASGPYPPASGPYPSQPGYAYPQQPYPVQHGSYPPPPPGYHPSKSGGGLLGKAQAAISSVLGPGVGGTALGAGLAGAAMTGHLNPKKAYKQQKKSHKKALKYGLPIAGVAGAGLGAYALSKGIKHKGFGGWSSSSSSSSSD